MGAVTGESGPGTLRPGRVNFHKCWRKPSVAKGLIYTLATFFTTPLQDVSPLGVHRTPALALKAAYPSFSLLFPSVDFLDCCSLFVALTMQHLYEGWQVTPFLNPLQAQPVSNTGNLLVPEFNNAWLRTVAYQMLFSFQVGCDTRHTNQSRCTLHESILFSWMLVFNFDGTLI